MYDILEKEPSELAFRDHQFPFKAPLDGALRERQTRLSRSRVKCLPGSTLTGLPPRQQLPRGAPRSLYNLGAGDTPGHGPGFFSPSPKTKNTQAIWRPAQHTPTSALPWGIWTGVWRWQKGTWWEGLTAIAPLSPAQLLPRLLTGDWWPGKGSGWVPGKGGGGPLQTPRNHCSAVGGLYQGEG